MVYTTVKNCIKSMLARFGIQISRVNRLESPQGLPRFASCGKNTSIELPLRCMNPERIHIGDEVCLGPGCLLFALDKYPTWSMEDPSHRHPVQTFDSRIVIGNNVSATGYLQIAAQKEIVIEDDVMFASNIHVNDGLHGFETADEPYMYQPMFRIAPIHIKRGCWIGQNVVVLPGVTIGELSIIGANSVVTKSVPARCIAVGSPARVIKKWDESAHKWVSIEKPTPSDAPAIDHAVSHKR